MLSPLPLLNYLGCVPCVVNFTLCFLMFHDFGVIMSLRWLLLPIIFHARTKHIKVDFHFVREKVLRRDIRVHFVSGKDNLAEVFTKPLIAPLFSSIVRKLMAVSSPIRLRGDVDNNRNAVVSYRANDTRRRDKKQAMTRAVTYLDDSVSSSKELRLMPSDTVSKAN